MEELSFELYWKIKSFIVRAKRLFYTFIFFIKKPIIITNRHPLSYRIKIYLPDGIELTKKIQTITYFNSKTGLVKYSDYEKTGNGFKLKLNQYGEETIKTDYFPNAYLKLS